MIKMKAIRAFGNNGENEGHVSRGREFSVADEYRARDLEDAGLAFRLAVAKEPQLNKMEIVTNKAADAGPFDSVGGTTGEDSPVLSSPPVRRRGRPRLHPLKED